jgi:hypothetical protein
MERREATAKLQKEVSHGSSVTCGRSANASSIGRDE